MKLQAGPVARYGEPRYPTRLEVLADPDLLRRHLPPGWRAGKGVAGAAALFLAVQGGAGCTETQDAPVASAPVQREVAGKPGARPAPAGNARLSLFKRAKLTRAAVAPIFDHGQGRGATGCVVISPPVFLSEEEALQVIREVLGQRGITPTRRDVTFKEVRIAKRRLEHSFKTRRFSSKVVEIPNSGKPLQVDLVDPDKQVAVEYVSQSDYNELGGPYSMSSVQSYNFKDVAENVRGAFKDQGPGYYFGAFYDPVGHAGQAKSWKAAQQAAAAQMKQQLRAQVLDFVKWLEAQGAI